MTYPTKQATDPWSGNTMFIEMTKEEYEEQLTWYQEYSKRDKKSASRRAQEYIEYLTDWFSNVPVDGFANVTERIKFHQLPMPFNVYFP